MIPSLPKLFITGYISKCYYNSNLICRFFSSSKHLSARESFLSHFLKHIRFSFFQQMTTLQGEAEDLTSASCCPKLIFQAMHIKKIRSEGTAIFFETG